MNQADFNQEMMRKMAAYPPGTPLLLHVCCAPCASTAIERLGKHFALTLFYYNPCTWPKAEYDRRLAAFEPLMQQAETAFPLRLDTGLYDAELFRQMAAPLAGQPEGGARCRGCFSLRLGRTAAAAAGWKIPLIATALTVGPRKNAAQINQIGGVLAEQAGVVWLPTDLKKQDGYKRSVALSQRYGLYRQGYCGCEYSRPTEA